MRIKVHTTNNLSFHRFPNQYLLINNNNKMKQFNAFFVENFFSKKRHAFTVG